MFTTSVLLPQHKDHNINLNYIFDMNNFINKLALLHHDDRLFLFPDYLVHDHNLDDSSN